MWNTLPHEIGHKIHHIHNRKAVISAKKDSIFYHELRPGSETISITHEDISQEWEVAKKYLGAEGKDKTLFEKWKLFSDVHQLYKIAKVVLGEYGMLTYGTEYAREAFYEAEKFVAPLLLDQSKLRPSSSYVMTAHLHGEPAYYQSYFLAEMNRLALVSSLKQKFGTSFSKNTAPFLIDKIMKGNEETIDKRILEATGVVDPIKNTIEFVNNASLCK